MFDRFNQSSPPAPGTPSVSPQGLERLMPNGVVGVNDVCQVLWEDRFSIPPALANSHGLDPAFVALTRLQVAFPQGMRQIVATSSSPWNDGLILRYYLDDDQSMIQVVTDTRGTILGDTVEIFSLCHQEQPSDLSLWLPASASPSPWGGSPWGQPQASTWWIGNAAYPLPNFPLDEDGLWPQWGYRRSWEPNPAIPAIHPRAFSEVIRLNTGKAQKIDHQFMAYHRPPPAMVLSQQVPAYGPVTTPGICENMLLCADTHGGSVTIRVWVGVEVAPDDLQF